MVKIQAERLPDLNVPRTGHQTLFVNGELTVLGGHTTGFIPTSTAEYLRDGQWHTVPMTYPHDNGMAVLLKNGTVLLAGGHKDNLGVGQTFEAEIYNPATHTFGNYGCMDLKRSLSSAMEIDSGRVVISGNWYGKDGIELFDGLQNFSYVKNVSVARATPYILRTAPDNVLIFGSQGTRGQTLGDSTAIVDRLRGEPFEVPLLREWKPVTYYNSSGNNAEGFIGNEPDGRYTYLLLVRDSLSCGRLPEQDGRPSGQVAIMQVCDTVFSLLPTVCPIPRESGIGGLILWSAAVISNRQAHQAYLTGTDRDKRLYLLCVDYSQRPAPLTIYYTDPLPDCGFNVPVLTADGNLLIAGGCSLADFNSTNYEPVSSVWLIRLDGKGVASDCSVPWVWWLLGLALIALAIVTFLLFRRRKATSPIAEEVEGEASGEVAGGAAVHGLFPLLCDLMERQQLFRNSELKVTDVASALATNTRYVSDCIRSERGQTFSQFVNVYRVEYAKQQLLQHPDKSVILIYTDAGFSSERSFFRIFKEATGMTTREWVNQQQKM